MTDRTQSDKTSDYLDQPHRINAKDECRGVYPHKDQGISYLQIQSNTVCMPLQSISNTEKSNPHEMSSPPTTDPLIYTPCSDHCSPKYLIDSLTQNVANIQIHNKEHSESALLVPCESNTQTEEEEEEDEEGCDEDDNHEEGEEYTSPECIDKCILEALKKRKYRQFLLNLEDDLCNFIQNSSQQHLEFPRLTRFHRLMVHRTADYFKIERTVDPSYTIIMSKTESSAIPALRFIDLVGELHNAQLPPIKVLRRCPERISNTCDGIVTDDHSLPSHSRSSHILPIEERQKNYCTARARIFQGDNSSAHEDNNEGNDGDAEREDEEDNAFNHSDHEIEGLNLIHAAESNLQTNENSIPRCINKTRSARTRQSLDQSSSDSIHPLPMRQSKQRGQRLVRTSSTSSNSSSGTTMTDSSFRSDSTTAGDHYSPRLMSGFLQSSQSPPSFCSICRPSSYGSAPGNDYNGRNNHPRYLGSTMHSRDQRQRHTYHSGDSITQSFVHYQPFIHQQPQLQQRPHYDHHTRNYSCSFASPPPLEFQNCACSQCPNPYTRNNFNTQHRPQSYPYSVGLAGPQYHHTQYLQPSPPMQSRGEMSKRLQQGIAYPYNQYQHQNQYRSSSGSAGFGSHSPNLQPSHTYDYQQRIQNSPPRCCEIYRSDGDQESQEAHLDERQGQQENDRYGGGRVTADAMAVSPSPRLFHVPVRPYPLSTGYRPCRQGISVPQQSSRSQSQVQNLSPSLQHQNHQYQYQYQPRDQHRPNSIQRSSSSSSSSSHDQEQHYQYHQRQQTQSTLTHPIPIPATRRHDSMPDSSRQPRQRYVSNKGSREFGSHMIYNVDARPPRSTELFDPKATATDKKNRLYNYKH